jgi:serine/threonine-protein kinase
MSGTTIGKYDVLEEIGRGGMAVVYRGYDRELEREVAIKVLHPHLSSQPESKRRFHREARAVARLRHANILEIFDYSGRDSDDTFIVTEFIHGVTLRTYCEEHPDMPTEVAALLAAEICRGLRHAHEKEVIHRDIKPENIMIRRDGVVKITDFGIAQMAGATQMTMTGQILGSPAHMSPEHVENKPLDFRADVFSMGTLMYWMTTGRLPFEGRNPHAVIKRIMEGGYADPLRVRPAIGEGMARILRRCLEVDPDDRYQTVASLTEDLEAFLKDLSIPVTARELATYFADPCEYVARHRPKLLATLIARGKEERREKRLQSALNYFNRVLSVDETNEEVLALVEGMTARVRLRRIAEASAAAAAVLAALFGAGYALSDAVHCGGAAAPGDGDASALTGEAASTTAGDASDASVAAVVRGAGRAAPDGAPPRVGGALDAGPGSDGGDSPDGAAAGDGAVPVVPDRRPPPPAPVVRRLVRIIPNPPAARVVVDGTDHGEYGAALARGLPLTVGSHEVTLVPRDRTYDELTFTLVVPPGGRVEEPIVQRRTLSFRPALVRIGTDASSAVVYIPGRERSRANRVFQVRLNAAEERVQMVVDADGRRSVVLDVVLRAGQEYSRDVILDPETSASGGPGADAMP